MSAILAMALGLTTGIRAESVAGSKPIDPADMDTTVKPGDNFYRFANGTWMKNHPVPAEYARWGVMDQIAARNIEDLRSLFEEAAAKQAPHGTNLQKIGDFYASGIEEQKIESEGVKPLAAELDQIAALKTKADLQKYIARMHLMGVSPLFNIFAEQDPKNSVMKIAWLYQGGLGLPDRDFYVEQDDRSKEVRAEYIKHLEKMFTLMGEAGEQARKSAETVMTIETRLAQASMTRLEQRDPNALCNKMTAAELARSAQQFDWNGYFATIGLDHPGDLNVAQPKFFKEVDAAIGQVSIDDWKIYLRWHMVHASAPYLSTPFVTEDFRFFGTFLTGAKELQPRWKRCTRTVSGELGEAAGQLYVEKYFPPEAKARALALVNNLKIALQARIQKLDWMSEETRKKAIEKLDAFKVKIGYPDKWIDYSTLDISRDSYLKNVQAADRFLFAREIRKMGKPVDRTEWGMTPQTVNAYYNPGMNEIVFPAAILQPPFFDFKADDAVNYGGIGSVIGHEMTHGFDDQGRLYDKNGNLNDWWTKEDGEKFKARADVLVKQYDQFVAVDNLHVNGSLTLGENIADLGGLNVSYDALHQAMNDSGKAETIDGFTPDQRFFLSWAKCWRGNIRKEALMMRLKTDVHSPAEFRTLGPLSDIPAFYAAFDVKTGDTMYRPESERAKIW